MLPQPYYNHNSCTLGNKKNVHDLLYCKIYFIAVVWN